MLQRSPRGRCQARCRAGLATAAPPAGAAASSRQRPRVAARTGGPLQQQPCASGAAQPRWQQRDELAPAQALQARHPPRAGALVEEGEAHVCKPVNYERQQSVSHRQPRGLQAAKELLKAPQLGCERTVILLLLLLLRLGRLLLLGRSLAAAATAAPAAATAAAAAGNHAAAAAACRP